MYNTESGSMTCWWAFKDRLLNRWFITTLCQQWIFSWNSIQKINCWVNYSVYEVLREDGISVTSWFTWVDFGEVYDDLKQDLLSKLANCGSQSFKEQIVDALINYAHVLGCKDENKLLDIGIANTVFHHTEETSLGSSDGLNMTPASLDAITSQVEEGDWLQGR